MLKKPPTAETIVAHMSAQRARVRRAGFLLTFSVLSRGDGRVGYVLDFHEHEGSEGEDLDRWRVVERRSVSSLREMTKHVDDFLEAYRETS